MVTWNVARHLLIQVGVAAALGAIASLAHVDWSALGGYGPLVASIIATVAATLTSLLNEVLAANK